MATDITSISESESDTLSLGGENIEVPAYPKRGVATFSVTDSEDKDTTPATTEETENEQCRPAPTEEKPLMPVSCTTTPQTTSLPLPNSACQKDPESAALLPPNLQALLNVASKLPPVRPADQPAMRKRPAQQKKKVSDGTSETDSDEGVVSESAQDSSVDKPSKRTKSKRLEPDAVVPPLPEGLPFEEMAARPPNQKSWTTVGPNGGRIQTILNQKAFYVPVAPKGSRHLTWSHYDSIRAAWGEAKRLAQF